MAAKRQERAIDNLPTELKKQVIDAMLAGMPSREVSRLIQANGGPYVSHVAVSGYRKEVLRPAIQTATKLQQLDRVPHDSAGMIQQTAEVTRAVIAADPILSRMEQRRLDRERLLKTAEDSADLRGWAAIDRNDISATELEARLTGRLDSQPTGGQVAVVVLPVAGLPGPAAPVPQVLPAGAVRFLPEGE
jgi:hypothetical protein